MNRVRRFSVLLERAVGPCPRGCCELVVIERWRDYWRAPSGQSSEFGRALSTGSYQVIEDHECAVLPEAVKR